MAQNSANLTNQGMAVPDWRQEIRYPDVPVRQVNITTTPATSNANHVTYQDIRGDSLNSMRRQGSLDMQNPLSQEAMENPLSNAEVYQGSLKSLLSRNLGYYIVAIFQVGTQSTVSVPGILFTVGNDYIILYQPNEDRYVMGDLYALKFVEFHESQSVPRLDVAQQMEEIEQLRR